MDRNQLENLLLAEALTEVERDYPEGLSNSAINLAKERLALVPTPLLVSGGQNVAKILTWAAAETELEVAGVLEEVIEDRFDVILNGPKRHTRFESDIKIGDYFTFKNDVTVIISDIRGDQVHLDYVKGRKAVHGEHSRDWMKAMIKQKHFRRLQ